MKSCGSHLSTARQIQVQPLRNSPVQLSMSTFEALEARRSMDLEICGENSDPRPNKRTGIRPVIENYGLETCQACERTFCMFTFNAYDAKCPSELETCGENSDPRPNKIAAIHAQPQKTTKGNYMQTCQKSIQYRICMHKRTET